MTTALHFGITPTEHGQTVSVYGHSDSNIERPVMVLGDRGIYAGFVSGSWKCWGPADQETDGDNTLHVLVVLGTNEELTRSTVEACYLDIARNIDAGRIVDYVLVTSAEDWSEQTGVVTFGGGCYLYSTTPQETLKA